MCLTCDGLGEFFSFDPERLITAPDKSFTQGCIELIGTWKDLGRWRRHIYRGVAETMERKLELAEGALLETPWQDLSPEHQNLWLWGTGDQHITFTWRAGKASQKYGGTYGGIIPELLEKYRTSHSQPQLNQLEKYMSVIGCPDCAGRRLNPQACAVTIPTTSPRFADRPARSLPEICNLAISEAAEFFSELELEGNHKLIAAEVLKEVRGRLGFLKNVGLDYLTLDRTAPTLSGGESQRIRLAGQIGCGLVGVLYILDEPSIGLHPRDNDQLLATLAQLRDLGNTVVVVEHDEDTMRAADHLIDFGPGPGVRGGEVVARGTADEIAHEKRSVTGAFLSGKRKIEVPAKKDRMRRSEDAERSAVRTRKPNSAFDSASSALATTISKTSTSKSRSAHSSASPASPAPARARSSTTSSPNRFSPRSMGGKGQPGEHDRIEGVDQLDKLIVIDQSPIGRTPRSNPGTYIKLFDDIRHLYTQLPESKRRGYKPGRFSFNVQGGRCEACEGNGSNRLEMDFLADVWVTCPVCGGHRFNRETLQVDVSRKEHRPSARDGRAAGPRTLRAHPADSPQAQHAPRGRPRLHQNRPALADAFRRRSATHQAGPRAGEKIAPAARCTCSTSQRPASTSPTSSCCLKCFTPSSTPATPCWSSNTISTSSKRPTGSSTSVPRAGRGRPRPRLRHARRHRPQSRLTHRPHPRADPRHRQWPSRESRRQRKPPPTAKPAKRLTSPSAALANTISATSISRSRATR